MWTEQEIISYLEQNLKKSRFEHSLSVRDTAVKLAEFYKTDVNKARVSGLVHDCGKYLKDDELLKFAKEYGYDINEICLKNPSLLHGVAGAYIAKNTMNINDSDILNAVIYHTTGKKNMSMLEKIIFIADYIEPLREFPGVDEIRSVVYEDMDKALIMACDRTIKYTIERGQLLHIHTVEARNYMVCEKYMEEI